MDFSFPIKRNKEHQKSEDMIDLSLAVCHFRESMRNPENEFRFSFFFSFLSAAEDAKQNKENAFLLVETDKENGKRKLFSIFCFPFLSRTRNEVKSEHEKQKTYNGKPFRFAVFQFQNTGERK